VGRERYLALTTFTTRKPGQSLFALGIGGTVGMETIQIAMQQQTKCAVHGHECHVGMFVRNLFVGQRIPLAGVAYQSGTIRCGGDRKTSALGVDCQAHDVDNLYAVDTSFFASSGVVNPALTIMANALRVGDHLRA
jgi:choline dehydrogenase-like flavoprotein